MADILVVEDDTSIRQMVRDILRADGYDVREAHNGLEALNRLRDRPADLILLDLMMPVMDGWTFVEECHRTRLCEQTPIVVTSAAFDLPERVAKLRPLGVCSCLCKPFDLSGLLALVEQLAPTGPVR